MTIRLRPHHLLCLLTYVGKGYSPAFTAGFSSVATRISAGETISVVLGPDDICAPMLAGTGFHCRDDRIARRDMQAAQDLANLIGHPIGPGQSLSLTSQMVARMRHAFRTGSIRSACAQCEWSDLCGEVAADGYSGAVLSFVPSDRPRA